MSFCPFQEKPQCSTVGSHFNIFCGGWMFVLKMSVASLIYLFNVRSLHWNLLFVSSKFAQLFFHQHIK